MIKYFNRVWTNDEIFHWQYENLNSKPDANSDEKWRNYSYCSVQDLKGISYTNHFNQTNMLSKIQVNKIFSSSFFTLNDLK